MTEFPHLTTVDGWLSETAARATDYLLQYQTARGLYGDVLEIGVYHGRYFIVLANRTVELERAYAIDIFGSGEPVIAGSAHGDREVFEANVKKYAPQCDLIVMESDSSLLPQEFLDRLYHQCRFVSVDGSHDEESVVNDLFVAEKLLAPGGLVALDDWRPEGNDQWPEVISGEVRYQADGGVLQHVGSIPNKLLLCNDPLWVRDYQKVLRDFATEE